MRPGERTALVVAPAMRETWGGVKARYRQGAGAATQDK